MIEATLKVTGISTRVVNAGLRNWIFVRVDTDQSGLYGWGEATLEWKTRAVTGAIEDLTPLVLGRDPRDIEAIVRGLHKLGLWRPPPTAASRPSSATLTRRCHFFTASH